MDRREQLVIWKRALAKIGSVKRGSFEGSKPLTDPYWKERLDPLHRPNTELNKLWNEFMKDNSYTGRDFYKWLTDKGKVGRDTVQYLDADERVAYYITFNDKSIVFSQEAILAEVHKQKTELIFVLDGLQNFYFGIKSVGTFHHSSLLAGAPVAGAGTMLVENGVIQEVNNHSGHYKPGINEMYNVATSMQHRGANLQNIPMKIYKGPKLEFEGTAQALLNQRNT